MRLEIKNSFNTIDSYQSKLILVNLYRIYLRLEISKNLGERIKTIVFTHYN